MMSPSTKFRAPALLWRYLRPQGPRVLLLAVLLLSSIGLQLLAPQVIRTFLDAAQTGRALGVLLTAAVLYLIIVVAQQILALAATYTGENVGWEATNQLRADLTGHCLRLDMGFHNTHTPGELIERIDGDVSTLGNYFSRMIIQVGGNGLLVVGILLLLSREDWRVGLIGSGYAVLVLLFLRTTQARAVRVWAAVRSAYARLFGFLEERLAGTEDIRANGAEAYIMRRFFPLQRDVVRNEVKGGLLNGFIYSTSYLLYTVSLVISLGLGATLFLRGEMSIGTVYLLVAYIGLLETPLTEIQRQIADLQQVFASIGRINELFQIKPQVRQVVGKRLATGPLQVTFEDVIFSYRDALPSGNDAGTSPVLHGISFQLERGRILGLLGRTGSGKTTLARLLFHLYDVDSGAIELDDVDIRDTGLSELRRRVGMVTQEVQLFAASVRDNLTFFKREISDEEILNALEQLGWTTWVQSLPDGLDTQLASDGKGLSAGEAQLLAFARVFLQDPGLIILDEASSRLDPATERHLEQAMDRLLAGRTGIIIAHRLQTVGRADDILILDGGRIVEYGSRHDLVNDPESRFYHLLQTGLAEMLA